MSRHIIYIIHYFLHSWFLATGCEYKRILLKIVQIVVSEPYLRVFECIYYIVIFETFRLILLTVKRWRQRLPDWFEQNFVLNLWTSWMLDDVVAWRMLKGTAWWVHFEFKFQLQKRKYEKKKIMNPLNEIICMQFLKFSPAVFPFDFKVQKIKSFATFLSCHITWEKRAGSWSTA